MNTQEAVSRTKLRAQHVGHTFDCDTVVSRFQSVFRDENTLDEFLEQRVDGAVGLTLTSVARTSVGQPAVDSIEIHRMAMNLEWLAYLAGRCALGNEQVPVLYSGLPVRLPDPYAMPGTTTQQYRQRLEATVQLYGQPLVDAATNHEVHMLFAPPHPMGIFLAGLADDGPFSQLLNILLAVEGFTTALAEDALFVTTNVVPHPRTRSDESWIGPADNRIDAEPNAIQLTSQRYKQQPASNEQERATEQRQRWESSENNYRNGVNRGEALLIRVLVAAGLSSLFGLFLGIFAAVYAWDRVGLIAAILAFVVSWGLCGLVVDQVLALCYSVRPGKPPSDWVAPVYWRRRARAAHRPILR